MVVNLKIKMIVMNEEVEIIKMVVNSCDWLLVYKCFVRIKF